MMMRLQNVGLLVVVMNKQHWIGS